MSGKKENEKILEDSATENCHLLEQFRKGSPDIKYKDFKCDKLGNSILHIAARYGYADVLKTIIEKDTILVDCKNKDDKTPLHEAAQFGQYECVKFLLHEGGNVNALKRADWTPLMLACTKCQENTSNRLKIIELLLRNSALVNYRNKDGWTAFHLICREGNAKFLKLLLEYEADIKLKTKNQRTGLHIACLHGNLDIVKHLCTLNVDVNVKDSCGNSAIHEAVLGNHVDIVEELLKYGADEQCRNYVGFSLVHLAASQSSMEVIEYVVNELNFDINDVTTQGFSPIHCAARKGRRSIYEFFCSKNANVDLLDNYGRKAEDYFKSGNA